LGLGGVVEEPGEAELLFGGESVLCGGGQHCGFGFGRGTL
jgi:hypothetical protein